MALDGKVALVTGAAMGIGKAMTEKLLQNGAKVVLLDVNVTAAESLVESLKEQYGQDRVLFLKCNVESEEQIKAAFQKTTETFGGIDILCNNAGIVNEDAWEKMVSINLIAVIKMTYLAVEHMNKLKGGQGGIIINTSSVAGIHPLIGCPVYTATKHGVVGFTRSMAISSAASGYGVRINCICPIFVQTDLYTKIANNMGPFTHLASDIQKVAEKIGVLDVSDVTEALLELATDETKNGEALVVFTKERQYMTFPSFQ